MVWMTPMLPFSRPPTVRPTRAIQMFWATPTTIMLNMVPMHPSSRTGLRPTRSDRLPQYMPIRASAREKAEMSRPA
ncbi:uncharacterized protein P884DRAFT_260365 [Thermothelomyces heterothallicus CBS 202.75]|uniref:uncharacterized protein n=1 Tax=Thermothelomyces heterothallicus CBS 202.75 TaxID=1149848 RepID=UPI0037430711